MKSSWKVIIIVIIFSDQRDVRFHDIIQTIVLLSIISSFICKDKTKFQGKRLLDVFWSFAVDDDRHRAAIHELYFHLRAEDTRFHNHSLVSQFLIEFII